MPRGIGKAIGKPKKVYIGGFPRIIMIEAVRVKDFNPSGFLYNENHAIVAWF